MRSMTFKYRSVVQEHFAVNILFFFLYKFVSGKPF